MKIKLGKKLNLIEPTGPLDEDKEYFPTFHIDESDHKGLHKVPDSGRATIKFKVTDRHVHESERDGKKTKGVSLTIEVQSFEVDDKKDKPKGNSDAREAFGNWAATQDE